MSKFIFERLVISDKNGRSSVVEFTNGLNLILGPVNTGKSLILECINYMLGENQGYAYRISDIKRIYGYDEISLHLCTDSGKVILNRGIDSYIIRVESTDKNVKSDDYSVDEIDAVYLKMLGIEGHNCIRTSSRSYNTKELSWRNMMHLFLVNDKDVGRGRSALLSPETHLKTESASILAYLLTGVNANRYEKMQILDTSNVNVKKYIETKISTIDREIEEIQQQSYCYDEDVTNKKEGISEEVVKLALESENVISAFYKECEHLTESKTLKTSFSLLMETYQKDLKRVQFIIDAAGVEEKMNYDENKIINKNELLASKKELEKIKQNIISLKDVVNEVEKREENSYSKIGYFKKKLSCLRNKMRSVLEFKDGNIYDRVPFLIEQKILYNKELNATTIPKYDDVFDEFSDEFLSYVENKTKYVFGLINRQRNIKFMKSYFDVEIDGKSKSIFQDGGLNSVLNMILLIDLNLYLMENNRTSPGFLLFDSALTQISDKIKGKTVEEIKLGLLNYLQDAAMQIGQVILFERADAMPKNYRGVKDVRFIEFTGKEGDGRYGFLKEVRNS